MPSNTEDLLAKLLAYTKMNNNELKAIHSELQALREEKEECKSTNSSRG